MTNLNQWQSSFSYSKSELNEYVNEIIKDTFELDWCTKREVLIQAKKNGLIFFDGEDCNAHKVLEDKIIVIPQVDNHERHKKV